MQSNRRLLLWCLLLLLLVVFALRWRAWHGKPPQAPPPPQSAAPARPLPHRPPQGLASPIHLPAAVAEDLADAEHGVFEGQVLSSEDQSGVPGASLTFLHEGIAASVPADDKGRFRFVPSAPGRFELSSITAAGFLPYLPALGYSPVVLLARAGSRVRDLTLYLERRETLVGVVLDPASHPVADAEVRIFEEQTESSGAPLHSDAQGEFRFSARKGALLEARHPQYAPGFEVLSGGLGGKPRVELRLRKRSGAETADKSIAGLVLDSAGNGIEGAQVTVRAPEQVGVAFGLTERIRGRVSSRLDGSFVFTGLLPGTYQVTASLSGLAPATADAVPAGTRELRLRLERGGSLCGEVRDADSGKPVPGFSVVVWPVRGPVERGESSTRSVFDAQGGYQVDGLAPGDYAVTVAAQRYAAAAEIRVHVTGDTRCVAANFKLSAGGKLFGKVVSKNGAPIAGAHVDLEGQLGSDSSPVPLSSSATADALGSFTMSGLSPGMHSIYVWADGHHSRILGGLQALPGGNLGPLTIELTPTAPGEAPQVEFVGIGAVLSGRGDGLLIGKVMAGGGAAEAGIAEGDAVLSIDGTPVTETGFESAIQRIRGPEGTTVDLLLRRADGRTESTLTVTRRRIRAGGR